MPEKQGEVSSLSLSEFLVRIYVSDSLIFHQVMWPRLIASKVLKKRLGSNNFVADFPINNFENLLDDQSLISSTIICNDDHAETQKYK